VHVRRATAAAALPAVALVVAGCGFALAAPPSDAPRADFCRAFASTAGIAGRAAGSPIQHWTALRSGMLEIRRIGTPVGSDADARTTVLRLSDLVANAGDEGDARVQLDGLVKDRPHALEQMSTAYHRLCS
jgi:hypothetical protein